MLEDKTKLQNLAFIPFENLISVKIIDGEKNTQNTKFDNTTKLQNLAFDNDTNTFRIKIIN